MACRDDDALGKLDLTGGADEPASRRSGRFAGHADGRFDTELERIGHGDLHLRGAALRAEHADLGKLALRSDDGHLLRAGVLPRLGQHAEHGQLMARSEQALDIRMA